MKKRGILFSIIFALTIIFSFQPTDYVNAETTTTTSTVRNGTCGLNGAKVYWEFNDNDGVMTISGSGAMDDYVTISDFYTGEILSSHKAPWDDFSYEIEEVIVKEGVTVIGENAFCDCNNLKKVTLADSVIKLRSGCFANNGSLSQVDLGKGLVTMENDIFWYAPLKSLTFPKTLKNIDDAALYGMWSLTDYYVDPDNPYFKSNGGVLYTKNGKELYSFPLGRTGKYTIPKGTTKIHDSAFLQCDLTEVVFPDTVTTLGDSVFSQADKLKTVTFPSKIKKIPSFTCMGCSSLTKVTLPKNLKEIDVWAFHDCPALMKIEIPASTTTIKDAFSNNTKVITKNKNLKKMADGSYVDVVEIPVYARDEYKKAFQVLSIVNKERKKAGLQPLTMDKSLLDTAMLRAHENVLYWDHTRPNSLDCFTANSAMSGENIAYGSSTAKGVMSQWMNSPGHKANILGGYKSIGIGCVKFNGTYYWVQCFSYSSATKTAKESSYSDKYKTRIVQVKKSSTYYKGSFKIKKTKLKVGQTTSVSVLWNKYSTLKKTNIKITSSNSKVCKVQKNGKIKALKKGKAVIRVYHKGYKEKALKKTITVTK